MRKASVAGQFYEGNKEQLREQIKECFLSKFGPGELPKDKENKERSLGFISPHAGFMFSGPAAAYAYKAIAESEKPDCFIILAPNHTGTGRTSFILEDFETPLGTAIVDKEFGKLLQGSENIAEDSRAHVHEHAIEVQLPFLQFLYKDDFRFVPIIISSDINIDKVAEDLKNAIEKYEKTGKKACIIASSDFTHYGYNYGYMPFEADSNAKENLKKLDLGAIELIKSFDSRGFMQYVNRTGTTICGFLAIYVMLKVLKDKQKCAELLTYYTSGDVIGDYANSVSYASIKIKL